MLDNNLQTFFGRFKFSVAEQEKLYLIEHQIEPVFGADYLPTIYEYEADEEGILFDNQRIDHSGLFLLYLLFDQYIYLILLLLIVGLLGMGLAEEYGKYPTIRIVATLPFSQQRYFYAKLVHAVYRSLLLGIGFVVFIVILATVFNRFGDWHYPILHYDHSSLIYNADYSGVIADQNGYHFISIGSYVLQAISLFSLVLIFLMILTHCLALFVKKTLFVYVLAAGLAGVGYGLTVVVIPEFSHLSPFLYLNIPKILNGEQMIHLDNPAIQTGTGLLVLGISISLLLLLSSLASKKERAVN